MQDATERDARHEADGGERTALVIGGSSGIGRAAAIALARDAYAVHAASRSADADTPAPGPGIQQTAVDICDEGSVAGLARRLDSTIHGLDVLVITAGSARTGRLAELSPADLERMLLEHVVGAFRAVKAFRSMLAARQGHVILVLSRMGRRPRLHGHAYGTAKAALEHLAGCLALDLAEDGIRVNCVSPGAVDTPQFRANLPFRDPADAMRPEEVADVIVELAGPRFLGVNDTVIDIPGPSARGRLGNTPGGAQ
ncbi:SDR family oxidoreductase [Streptantibioticus ferralitis]|uniref:SDR family NAD(P)-dependent oxidoreductase n=1 Tax=Streptantibioticus ferralitis TaxID=236510 RepID=A0ABT5Z203_9ACTN|nr:SDR family oxidoreductase [Streptantibioticus ferralitis]MDF2257724.1 SDR family NAD(P)-dependent oxidoreductase [Streptantibioticus ferralitis]